MTKEEAARVRDELLQSFYADVLRQQLAFAAQPPSPGGEALAAGLHANLRSTDLLLLPARAGGGLRLLCGVPARAEKVPPARDLAAGIVTLPRSEAGAVAFALGAAASAAHGRSGALVAVLLPSTARLASPEHKGKEPQTWADAGLYAARLALPLLLISDGLAGVASLTPDQPAPVYPSIPVDRDDALAIYRVAFECASRARSGGGPSHIAAVPFRVRGAQAPVLDALMRLESMLRERAAFDKKWRKQLEQRLIRELSGH